MATTTTTTNKPLNPRAQDLSPKGYNRANIFSGKALDFDGVNDYVSAPNISVQSTNVWTYESKIYFDAIGGYWFDGRTSDVGYGVYLDPSSKKLNLFTNVSGANSFNYTFDVGRWYSIALTSNGTTAALYVEGKAVASLAYTDAPSSAGPLILGARFSLDSSWIDARFAGLRVFNTALTPAQVSDLYLNPEKIVPDGVASSALKLWLPMMEGAGASAYDGSGNGTDGTINGATWTAGIGAPVAQTALVSWNKGRNLLTYSEDFTNAVYFQAGVGAIAPVRTANQTTAPDGQLTADKIVFPAVSGVNNLSVIYRSPVSLSGAHNSAIYLKGENGGEVVYLYYIIGSPLAFYTKECVLTTEWQRFDIDFTGGAESYWHLGVDLRTGSGQVAQSASTIYAWGTNTNAGSLGPYIKTNATAQTSDVLVPEGLTAGASIFGTDIITPRNAFALNLDGASWAQVGDNASLDITSAITLEAWVYWDGTAYDDGILGRWGDSASDRCYMLYGDPNRVYFYISSSPIFHEGMATGWRHIVGTYDKINTKIYIDGQQETSSTAITIDIPTSSKNLEIGTYRYSGSRNYNDQLANPRIYNRALTAAEVLRNYNADRPKFGL